MLGISNIKKEYIRPRMDAIVRMIGRGRDAPKEALQVVFIHSSHNVRMITF